MCEREVCILLWSFVAGVAFAMFVLRAWVNRMWNKTIAMQNRAFDAQQSAMRRINESILHDEAVRKQLEASVRPPPLFHNVTLCGGTCNMAVAPFASGQTRYTIMLSTGLRACYRREPGASTAKFVAVLSADEAKAWASREGSAM